MADDERRAVDGRPIGDRANNGRTRGLVGVLNRARSQAPEDADEEAIHAVAITAWQDEREVADVWAEANELLAEGVGQ